MKERKLEPTNVSQTEDMEVTCPACGKVFVAHVKGDDRFPAFHEQLRAARKSLGCTQAAAAARIGCPLRTYEEWESGRRTPKPLYREMILQKLSDSPNDVASDSGHDAQS